MRCHESGNFRHSVEAAVVLFKRVPVAVAVEIVYDNIPFR